MASKAALTAASALTGGGHGRDALNTKQACCIHFCGAGISARASYLANLHLYCILTALMHGTVILIILNARDSCSIVISGVLSRSVGRHLKQRSCSPRGAPRAPQTGTQHVCSRVRVRACERGGQDKERAGGVGENTTRPIPIQMYDILLHISMYFIHRNRYSCTAVRVQSFDWYEYRSTTVRKVR